MGVMRKILLYSLCMVFVVALSGCSSSGDNPPKQKELTVYAASNLAEVFTEIKQAFEEKTGYKVTISFAGSQTLRTQIEQGAPADVFASADISHMESLYQQGLVEKDHVLSYNTLALILPVKNPAGIKKISNLSDKKLRYVSGVSEVPIGIYTNQLLENGNKLYGPDFKDKVLSNIVSLEGNTKQIVGKIAIGEGDAGFVYASDIIPSVQDKVIEIEIPKEINIIATNTIAMVKDPRNAEEAQQWIAFVLSDEGQEIFAKHKYIKIGGI
jgi:molybdate transport system substrate-binding protein